jgi:sulfide:quinone oxidoreductase
VLPKAGTIAEAQGEIVAQRIADTFSDHPPTATFDGKGYCHLETGGGRAVQGEASFFVLPHPVMSSQPPTIAQFAGKVAGIARHLTPRR